MSPVLMLVAVLQIAPLPVSTPTNLISWYSLSNSWNDLPTEEIVRRASDGDPLAECYLGHCYLEGLRGYVTNHAAGKQWLTKSAEKNLAQAQNTLGWNAANGISTATNLTEALHWYRRAADQGFPQAEMNIARMYRSGSGVPQDIAEAIIWYRRSAQHGFRFAMSELGFLLCDEAGLGGAKRAEGLEWLHKAAAAGDANAQNRIGYNYWKGEVVERNLPEARKWLLAAAEQGSSRSILNLYRLANEENDRPLRTNVFRLAMKHPHDPAVQYLIGNMYGGGLGVAIDHAKQLEWYEKAAAQDYGPALQAAAGQLSNLGPRHDKAKALRYYKRAAEKGMVYSQGEIARSMLSKPETEREGLSLLMKAAEAGDPGAQYEIANRYYEGSGLPKDITSAIHWYSLLSSRPKFVSTDQERSAMVLGVIYATGDGVPRDDAEAVRWFRLWGPADAKDSLGYCYATGRGVPQNDELAVRLFARAISPEPYESVMFYPALVNLGVMRALGRGGPTNIAEALTLFQRATNIVADPFCKIPQARTALAICAYEGIGMKRDTHHALGLFREAADHGHPQAQLHAGVLEWLGQDAPKNPGIAYMYLHAAAENEEPGAAAWRDYVAKRLNASEISAAVEKAKALPKGPARCARIWDARTWNFGLQLPNLAVVRTPPGSPGSRENFRIGEGLQKERGVGRIPFE